MQLSHSVMAALLNGAEGSQPVPPTPVARESERADPLPTRVLVGMVLGEPGRPSWDYDFEPWPPCSFG